MTDVAKVAFEAGTWILAIDSSTTAAGVGLTDGERWAELNWTAGRDQTVSLLDQIDRLLILMGLGANDLSAVAVATGPGMFSGLRVGLGVAKGLVLGTDVPLIGVSTLEATALPFVALRLPVFAVVAAGRGRLVWGTYRAGPSGDPESLSPARNGTAEEFATAVARVPEGAIVCGELTAPQAELVSASPNALVPSDGARQRRALAVAELGVRRLARGETDDAVTLEPVYLHARSSA